MNIQFLDREEELKIINKLNKNNFFIIIKGRRRIGKTTFLQKVFQNAVYIFIWPNKSIEWINNEVCKENNLPLFKNFGDIIKYLLEKKKTIIIDEFQNFLSVEKSIYGEIQKIIDENKNKFLKMAVAGSSYSLINKVFNDVASPLYGRKSAELTLSHLPIKDIFKEVKRPLEEFIKFWSIFQGVPYYYEFINKEPFEKLIKQLFLSKNALLREEGKSILAMEFGSNSKNYNTVLSAISEGKTKFNEISSFFGGKKNETIKYLDLLRKEFKLVKRLTPVTSDPKKTKEGIYSIKDNLLEFWFNFVDKQQIYAEQ
ncbi:MAG: AAA family ATPase, partial [Nanoarchaeota archaeon]|nr:AAA family ATPase [Nanoarchaeota archaeon]